MFPTAVYQSVVYEESLTETQKVWQNVYGMKGSANQSTFRNFYNCL
jgi:hypothetical protein